MSIRLLVVESSEYVQYGIRAHMDKDPDIEICDIVGTLKDGILSCRRKRPDIVLIDLALLHLDTKNIRDVISQIKTISPSTRTIFWSDIEENELLVDIIMSGTDGYLPRNRPVEELNKVLTQVHQGIVVIYTQQSSNGIANHIQSTWLRKGYNIPRLSKREWQILDSLNQGHSNTQIAAKIGIKASTVSVFVSRIIKKLKVRNRSQVIIQAQKLGLIQLPVQNSG
jgi:DNA-binding NarL/FixJ family response regulator